MTPVISRIIPQEDQYLFWSIHQGITNMENPDLGKDGKGEEILISCHMLARAVVKVFNNSGLTVHDGYYMTGLDHSWLKTKNGNVIDVYPIRALGGPILIESIHGVSPGYRLYKDDPEVMADVINRQAAYFDRCVDQLAASLTAVLIGA